MDIVKIQTLIAQGRVVELTDIDPTQSFVQIGVYQPDNRKIGSANNSYPSFVIPLSEIGGGGTNTSGTLTATVDLNTDDLQSLIVMPTGSYIVEKVYLSQASIDLSASPVRELIVSNSGIEVPAPWNTTKTDLFTTLDPGPCPPPGCDDLLNTLSIPQMYAALLAVTPVCYPPPCNAYIITGGESLDVKIVTPTGVPATAQLHVVIRKIG